MNLWKISIAHVSLWEESVETRVGFASQWHSHILPCSLSALTNLPSESWVAKEKFKDSNAVRSNNKICNASAIQIVAFLLPNKELCVYNG